ncbi:MAG: hypothetical protein HRT94_07140 [Alphaproteobacteria bacterium]|nr:hypothetical protein [Alphaproteobacteria bacterium]
MRLLSLCTLVLLTLTTAAHAAPAINDEGAAKVKALIEGMLERQKNAYSSTASQFVTDGDVQVEQAKTYYAVTLPDITVISQRERKGEVKKLITKIGIIGMNVLPTDNPKEWKMTVAIPTPIKYMDENQTPLMKMGVERQQMMGIWNEDLDNFSKINANYNDIIFSSLDPESEDKDVRIRVRNIGIKSNFTQDENNLWSGPSNILIEDTVVEKKYGERYTPLVRISKMNMAVSASEFSAEAQRKLEDFTNNIDVDSEVEDPTAYLGIFPIFLDLMDSSAFKITMNDLNILPTGNAVSREPLKLDEAFFGFGISGLRQKMLGNTLSFGWHGLSGVDERQNKTQAIPKTVSFSFALENLPLQPLIDMGSQLVDAGVNKDNIAQMAMMNAMMSLPQKLSDAGTKVSLKDTMMKHKNYQITFDGHLKATQESIIGVNGGATIKSLGVNNAIILLNKQKERANEERKAQLDQLIAQLSMIQKFGQDDPSGSDVKTIEIVLDNQGQTLINGQNMKEVMAAQMQQQTGQSLQ